MATSLIGTVALWVVCVGALTAAALWAATPVLLSGWQATSFAAVADIGVAVGLCALSDRRLMFAGCMLFVMIGAYVTINVPPLGLFAHTVFVTAFTVVAVTLMAADNSVSPGIAAMGTAIWLWVLVGAPLTVRRIWVGTSAEADMASYDPLTGLLNRAGLESAYRTTTAATIDEAGAVMVVVVDLDKFKAINDRHGHHVGDAVINEAAKLLADHFGNGAAVARSGGEEFTVIATGAPSAVTELVLQTPTSTQGRLGPVVTMSIGAAACVIGEDGDPLQAAAAQADESMYGAKHAGGNQVRIHGHPRLIQSARHPPARTTSTRQRS